VALTVIDPAQRERFVFASDVQGPLSPVAAAYLIRQRPTVVYLSGPPSYIEREVGAASIEQGVEHLLRLVDATGCRVIMDHHALRDLHWSRRFDRLWQTGRVTTAAGFLGMPAVPLECRRHELWAQARKPAAKAPVVKVPAPGGIMAREAWRRATRSGARRYAE
jgi:predicted metallo-beta-lactamase superfamily hydrolase